MNIHEVLEELAATATDPRDKGTKFEQLVAAFFKIDPLYKDKYEHVWLWNDWPDKPNTGDVGIDLVAQDRATHEFCAIQCKFYDKDYSVQKGDIDSFFTASGKAHFTSRLIITTTDKWSSNAENALQNQQIPVSRIGLSVFENSSIEWSLFSPSKIKELKLKKKKEVRPHQRVAIDKVKSGFATSDRGKLIMACGTGKTYTALKLVEEVVPPKNAYVLFLVPSISLLSQTLLEWTAQSNQTIRPFAVCSDSSVGKSASIEDIKSYDLEIPATTNPKKIYLHAAMPNPDGNMTVIFSTYHSIQVLADAQKLGLPEFDIVVCDEAHRTTGVKLADEDDSAFQKIHDQKYIKAKKRLYMTATPRIYADSTKVQAEKANAEICSMDDTALFGPEFHRLGFGEAVGAGLLSDYKVMVLAVDEKHLSIALKDEISNTEDELKLDDAVKIIGCWNGLSKRLASEVRELDKKIDPEPMRRAVAFSRSIKDSKRITDKFEKIINEYIKQESETDHLLKCELKHVDGTDSVLYRNKCLDWIKQDTHRQGNLCRILSNARCLTEGVDVPALDAVLFLNPRDSVVDVVQAVGRVMRKAEGKKYGYIILPIGIPADKSPEDALKDNKKYQVVWQVLQALRAHDDRFNAMVNKIDLNQEKPPEIDIIGVGGVKPDEEESGETETETENRKKELQGAFSFDNIAHWRDAIYARIVQKCGDRRYWENWAKDVAQIAERHVTRIKALLADPNQAHRQKFNDFLAGLRSNINPGVTENDAIEMLSQHLITRPIFEALFEGYEFARLNPVSITMQAVLDDLDRQGLEKETTSLQKFYESVKQRASGIDNAAGRQKIIIELYDKFFKAAFPRMAERLGIVFTPVEVVDFILKSADYALRKEFNLGIGDKDVHLLDPFTGTGTFIVRLLQSGLIPAKSLAYKYKNELHANELVLLSYYIASINIEDAYHSIAGGDYVPFEGIVLTDTFQTTEGDSALIKEIFPENSNRVKRQKRAQIRVIVGNPPYKVGQESVNDANQNQKYEHLDNRIKETYVSLSQSNNKNSAYDAYKRSLRWCSDRIKNTGGIICLVCNGSFIDDTSADGIRKTFSKEFSSIYVFNLRGNARTSGEQRRTEGGSVFGEGTRTQVAITLFVKKPNQTTPCEIFYHDIGDYLSREEKLRKIDAFDSVKDMTWEQIIPNEAGDWINQRDDKFGTFNAIAETKAKPSFFSLNSPGVQTNRDPWAYNFSKYQLQKNILACVSFYNNERERLGCIDSIDKSHLDKHVNADPRNIKWTNGLIESLANNKCLSFHTKNIKTALYRPFCKSNLYFSVDLNHRQGTVSKSIVKMGEEGKGVTILSSGIGSNKEFSALITNVIPDVQLLANGQCFPLYTYEGNTIKNGLQFDEAQSGQVNAITDEILKEYRKRFGETVLKSNIFYYVYGVLHSPEYRRRFAADLKKMLPRIPYSRHFWKFAQAGEDLAQWHLNYETIEPYPLDETTKKLGLMPKDEYRVEKMTFGKVNKEIDKSVIVFNSNITFRGIPLEVYDYVVNGKPALEWIMERYQVTKDKDSGIVNDPNEYSDDPKYIYNLVKRIVTQLSPFFTPPLSVKQVVR